MSIAIVCVILAGFLPLIAAGIAKFGPTEGNPKEPYDNHQPRQWLAQQSGLRARANAAQANTFESLPFFYVAIVIALMFEAPEERVDVLAVTYLLARVAYIICYIQDWANLRSLVWTLGLVCTVALFFQI
jgi:uncharacterized MAPEG superfamily protein